MIQILREWLLEDLLSLLSTDVMTTAVYVALMIMNPMEDTVIPAILLTSPKTEFASFVETKESIGNLEKNATMETLLMETDATAIVK